MKQSSLLRCKFSNWYPDFKDLTIKSYTIPLPNDFVAYLKNDGPLLLPQGLNIDTKYEKDEEDEDNLSHWDDVEDGCQNEIAAPEFPDLMTRIKGCIGRLSGAVFPKLTWSAPRDAAWMTNNSLKCNNPGEIILLLKSSDFVAFDLSSVLGLCDDVEHDDVIDHELVLRKWANLVPGMEFRCFVKDNTLVAVSQRNCRQHYDYIEKDKDQLATEIQHFVTHEVIGKFPDVNYIVDIYKKRDGNYWIIDFNPFFETTDALLFTWDELASGRWQNHSPNVPLVTTDGNTVGQFRYASANSTMQPSDLLTYRMPSDFVDLSAGNDATKFVDLMRMKIQNGDESSSDDDDDRWQLPSNT